MTRKKAKKPAPPPPTSRAFTDIVFARADPADVAVKILKGRNQRLKAQVLTLLLAYRYGKPTERWEATGPGGGPLHIVWDIPRPAREAPPEQHKC